MNVRFNLSIQKCHLKRHLKLNSKHKKSTDLILNLNNTPGEMKGGE